MWGGVDSPDGWMIGSDGWVGREETIGFEEGTEERRSSGVGVIVRKDSVEVVGGEGVMGHDGKRSSGVGVNVRKDSVEVVRCEEVMGIEEKRSREEGMGGEDRRGKRKRDSPPLGHYPSPLVPLSKMDRVGIQAYSREVLDFISPVGQRGVGELYLWEKEICVSSLSVASKKLVTGMGSVSLATFLDWSALNLPGRQFKGGPGKATWKVKTPWMKFLQLAMEVVAMQYGMDPETHLPIGCQGVVGNQQVEGGQEVLRGEEVMGGEEDVGQVVELLDTSK